MHIIIITAVFIFIVDFFIKSHIETQPASYWRRKKLFKIFPLNRVHNHGMLLGFLKERTRLVRVLPLAVVAAAFIGFLSLNHKQKISFGALIGMGLLIGGGANNSIERAKKGYVVDYVHLPLSPIRRIAFNLSDFSIFAGCLTVLFHYL